MSKCYVCEHTEWLLNYHLNRYCHEWGEGFINHQFKRQSTKRSKLSEKIQERRKWGNVSPYRWAEIYQYPWRKKKH